MTPALRAQIDRVLKILSQPTSMAGYVGLAAILHITAPQYNALAGAIAALASLALVLMDDGSNTTEATVTPPFTPAPEKNP
jgi:hypothetical protein